MNRIIAAAAALLLALLLASALSPSVRAADPTLSHSGRVLISTGGDITVPAGEQADLVLVVHGTARINGQVNTIVVIDGAANLAGARTESIFAVRSPVTLGAGTVILGDVMRVDSQVLQVGDAQVHGSIRDLAVDAAGIGLLLAPAIILLFLGFALAAIAAGLLLAALASRQVRKAEALISHRPIATLAAGLGGVVLPIFVVILLMVTVVGAPLGLGILFGLWPLTGFVGYLVAGIWIGDWVLRRMSPAVERERPYLATVIGLLLIDLLGIVPPLAGIASLFGFGAVILLAWQTIRPHEVGAPSVQRPASAPIG